ncbi:MAG TPA: hypothetical protein VJL58_03220, partial [Pyrinomonadaceae bacterium]|nr:hypothetical protein [Pyrinomonadaceae bacterium]
MKFTALLLIVAVVAISALGQTKKPAAKPQQKPASAKPATKKPSTPIAKKLTQPKPVSTPKPVDENAEFEAALSAEPLERVNALKKFIVGFPNSERTPKAKELLVVARASVADDKLRSGETETAVSLFILAVDGAPEPIPDKLFADVISKFPYNLYFGGQKPEALAIASKIESRVSTNAAQLVTLAKFHASIENGGEAIRVAEIAVNLDPNSSPAYQAIGLGHRLNFELEKSAAAYSKALELDPESLNSKQSLAEMNRALGKADEAAKLYREMLAVAEGDVPAQTGLVLSLFDGDKKTEAEAEMAKALEANPNNVTLIAGAAYWYSANGDPDKAIELGEKAIALEPRYVWSHIAYARGLAGKQKPVDAERVLIKARSYGNFPTVEFELASARLAAGFYREAVEDLQRSFALKDGNIVVKLGGRTERTGAGFEELLAAERRASIFAPSSGGNATSDQKLKQLLELHKEISASDPDIASIATTVDEFTSGTDSMKVHRQLYAASLLLQKNVALDKVVDVARSATGNTDSGLDSPNAGSAVMASELYESRSLAFSRNEFLLVPEVPRQTLSVILRGRVEDIAGWA